ncbi:MAG: LapA family protein [Kangiellaceae bacterium]|nr:LapA family protein [Kangiellaceae bacterium]
MSLVQKYTPKFSTATARYHLLKKLLITILFILVLVISALFFAQNDASVEINYFGGNINLPLNWVLVSVFIGGLLTGFGFLFSNLISTKIRLANARRSLAIKEKEVSNLRSLPIKNDY